MNGLARRSRLFGAALGLVGLLVAPGAASGQAGGEAGAAPSGGYVYVPNQADATISVVDTETRRVVATVDLRKHGFSANAKPHDVVGAPDGSAWYVSLINDNKVVKFGPDNEVLGTADFEVPGMLAISPSGDVLYVGRSMSAVNPPKRIGRIETDDMSIREIEVLYGRPHAIVMGPDGEWVHSASLAVNQIGTLRDGSDRVEITPVEGPTHVFVQMAVSPDGKRLVATGQMSNSLLVFDRSNLPVLTQVATVEVGTWPWHPAFTPDGRYVVFGDVEDVTSDPFKAVAEKIKLEGEPSRGPKDAKVTIVEYSDFQCPYCARAHATVEEQVMKEYGGKVRLVYKHFPLGFHKWAELAAIGAECAAQQSDDAFWKLYDYYFTNQRDITPENLRDKTLAALADTKVDQAKFTDCYDNKKSLEKVKADMAEGQEVGVTGTPAFIINGRKLSGAQPFDRFKAIIDDELSRAGS